MKNTILSYNNSSNYHAFNKYDDFILKVFLSKYSNTAFTKHNFKISITNISKENVEDLNYKIEYENDEIFNTIISNYTNFKTFENNSKFYFNSCGRENLIELILALMDYNNSKPKTTNILNFRNQHELNKFQ